MFNEQCPSIYVYYVYGEDVDVDVNIDGTKHCRDLQSHCDCFCCKMEKRTASKNTLIYVYFVSGEDIDALLQ